MSVCPSVHLCGSVEQLCSYWMDFHEILYLSIFQICVEKLQVPLKSDKKITGTLREDQYTILIISH